ncbi:MAG: L-rhamnose isomerase [Spirochaetales bacterium]
MYKSLSKDQVNANYAAAKQAFALLGVDTDGAVAQASAVPLSLHCWQGDDVTGFENADQALTGGILATGNYPGKARNAEQLRADLALASSLIPGAKKISVHALYAETNGKKIARDELGPEHFANWIAWAQKAKLGLDFNPSFFSHPKADHGTLSAADKATREFWIRHGIQSRRIAAAMGKATGAPASNNVWIPDGTKDLPADRLSPRLRLKDSLDAMFAEKFPASQLLDAVECKLFGIGSEAYVVGSHEFYMGYAVQNKMALTLDMGHFHPTETIADKIPGMLPFVPGLLLHVSRGLRWDSDHVVTYNDDVQAVFTEIQRAGAWNRVAVGLDFFDASINRIMAWTIGARAARKAMLSALLEPSALLKDEEAAGRFGARLALMEELKNLPLSAVWDKLCLDASVPTGASWINVSDKYESEVLSKR